MRVNLLYLPVFLLFALPLLSCHNGKATDNKGANENDTMKAATASAMTATVVDPSNAFPKPPVTGPQEDSSRTYDSTSWFIANALQQNGDQIILADLAIEHAANKDLKKIASHVKTQHKALVRDLQKSQTAIPASVRSSERNSVARHSIEMLKKLSGNDFDKNWIDAMIEQHQHMLHEYRSILTREPAKKIKNYIKDAVPRLEALLQELQSYSSIIYKT